MTAETKENLNYNKTTFVNESTRQRNWYVIDAKDKVLGRLACEVARILRGKRKANFTPHCDNGDFVIIINAEHIMLTGKDKEDNIKYYKHSGYIGHLKTETLGELLKRRPEQVFINAVSRMLPKATHLRSLLLKKLKVYAGDKHPHSAQNPILIQEISNI